MCRRLSSASGVGRRVFSSGSSARRGASSASASVGSPAWITSTSTNDRPRIASGISGSGGSRSSLPDGRQLVGKLALGQLAPGLQHLGVALDRPPEDAGVDLGERVEGQLEGGHDPEAASAAAQRPEEVGLGVAVDAQRTAVGGHELDGEDAVRAQAVLAPEEAQPSTERVADDPDVRRGAGERRQPVLRGRLDDVLPQRAGLDAGDSRLRVDQHALHALRLQEQRSLQGAQRRGPVTGALRRDTPATGAGELDCCDDLGGRLRQRDRLRPLVGGEVPGLACAVPVVRFRVDDVEAMLDLGGHGRLLRRGTPRRYSRRRQRGRRGDVRACRTFRGSRRRGAGRTLADAAGIIGPLVEGLPG